MFQAAFAALYPTITELYSVKDKVAYYSSCWVTIKKTVN